MAVDQDWIDSLAADDRFLEADTWRIEGVEVEMPVPRDRANREREWQRRVIDDVLPDSPYADAAEKIPFRLLNALTTAKNTDTQIGDALAGEFSPLGPIFQLSTQGRKHVPIAFHVLAVKAAPTIRTSRVFTERTIGLLLSDQTGTVDEELLCAFLNRFRRPPHDVDLAQQLVLSKIHPHWNREVEFTPELDVLRGRKPPFMQDAGDLFRRDVETLVDAELSNSEFFNYVNLLFALHLGLYQPRLAWRLNRAMTCLYEAIDAPDRFDTGVIESMERGSHPETRFDGRLGLRAPYTDGHRRVSLNSDSRRSYSEMERQLSQLHFSLLMFHRVRRLTKAYMKHEGHESADARFERTRRPSLIVERLQWFPKFRKFLHRASEALAVRFVHDQLSGSERIEGKRAIRSAQNGLRALESCYQIYNLQGASKGTATRAYKQGTGIANALLRRGEYGIIHTRRGVGSYFELGTGLIPLLLILILQNREKLRVDEFWQGLSEYGLDFASSERELLLERLKSMGLYERFSDAGEANYIRNLLISQ